MYKKKKNKNKNKNKKNKKNKKNTKNTKNTKNNSYLVGPDEGRCAVEEVVETADPSPSRGIVSDREVAVSQ